MESGNLNFQEPSGPLHACNGTALPLPLFILQCPVVTICKISKGLPRQVEVAQAVPGRLRPRISWRFDTTRVVGRQAKAPAAFTPGGIPGTHFQRLSRPQGTWFFRGYHGKKSAVTPPGIDPGTFQLVAQCLNHYVTPGPQIYVPSLIIFRNSTFYPGSVVIRVCFIRPSEEKGFFPTSSSTYTFRD